jgi:hypothetical protein
MVSGLGRGIAPGVRHAFRRRIGQCVAQVAGQEVLEQRPVTAGELVIFAGEEGRGAEVGFPQVRYRLPVVALQVRASAEEASNQSSTSSAVQELRPERHSSAARYSMRSRLCSGWRVCLPPSRESPRSTNSPYRSTAHGAALGLGPLDELELVGDQPQGQRSFGQLGKVVHAGQVMRKCPPSVRPGRGWPSRTMRKYWLRQVSSNTSSRPSNTTTASPCFTRCRTTAA